jgi:hypothetical protein
VLLILRSYDSTRFHGNKGKAILRAALTDCIKFMTQKNIFQQNVKFEERVRKELRKKSLPQRNPSYWMDKKGKYIAVLFFGMTYLPLGCEYWAIRFWAISYLEIYDGPAQLELWIDLGGLDQYG